jgi:geranylgeranyl diphosphate synthase type I
VELLHNFSLLHDDIMDGDEQRRGRPTVWKLHGVSAAMLVGDALHALAIDTLLAHGGPAAVPATRRLSKAMMELAAGQAQDMQFAQRPWVGPGAVSVEEYRAMAEAKTGSLLACAVAVGALLGGGGPHAVASLAQAACHLGLAFQCVDDVIGIWGSPEVSGKPVFGDLRERKKTLPVVAALRASTPASRQLVELLTHPSPAGGDLQLMAKLIEDAGGRQFAEREAQRELAAARRCLDEVPMRHAVREQFNTLAQSLIHREH